MLNREIFKPRIVLGTPITPKRILRSLQGSSFCVSHYRPDDLEDAIQLVGEDEILLLDNGAFSFWRKGAGRIDREAFWNWANEIQRRCPQAVAVIPDVIGGTEEENLLEISWALREGLAEFPERIMAIWHLDESLDQLRIFCRLLNFVGFGSCAEFDIQRRRQAFRERIREASLTVDLVETLHDRRPWLHLMRGLGIFHELGRFESADSTNVAVNHQRYKAEFGDDRGRYLKDRIQEKILAGLDETEVEIVTSSISNFAEAPTLRPKL